MKFSCLSRDTELLHSILPRHSLGTVVYAPFQPLFLIYSDAARLTFSLKQRRACNAVVVKLISPEDKMAEWADDHDSQNIDATVVALKGRVLRLPDTLHLQL